MITGVHSAATNMAPTTVTGLAPQMLVAIVGTNLSTAAATTGTYPWQTRLAGTTVTFNGTAAALAYVSASQINAVVPSALAGSASATVVVTTASGSSAPFTIPIAASALGIFTQDMTGCGQAVAFNIHADGSISMNTPQNSLDPVNDWGLTLYLTGIGAFADRSDGVPWQFNAADNRSGAGGVNAYFASPNDSVYLYSPPLGVTYAGPVPLQSGVDQVDVALSTAPAYVMQGRAPEGCRVPLYLHDSVSASQVVNVSIHRGGGACSDSPADSLGLLTWQQNMVSDAGGPSASSSVGLQFLKAPGIGFNLPQAQGSVAGPTFALPSFCAAAYPATMSAGTVTVSGGSTGAVTLQPQTQDGILTYQAALPSTPGGTYTVSGAGSDSGVGAFTAASSIPPPIAISNTNLAPGTPVTVPFTLNWTGGDARSVVTVQYIATSHPGQSASQMVETTVSASAGTATVSQSIVGFGGPTPPLLDPGAEIIVTQQPAAAPAQPFTAPALSLGGAQTWKYVWDYRGLSNQPKP